MLRPLAAIVLALLTTTLALADDPQLVTRGHAKVTLSGAQAIIAAAKTKAEAMKLKVNIAVVDDGGHLLAFARMDGARPASSYTAMTKATAAARTFSWSTGSGFPRRATTGRCGSTR